MQRSFDDCYYKPLKVGRSAARLVRLYAENEGRCFYCNCVCELGGRKNCSASIDHYMPKALGGANGWSNLRLACRKCNGLKGDSSVNCLKGVCLEDGKTALLRFEKGEFLKFQADDRALFSAYGWHVDKKRNWRLV